MSRARVFPVIVGGRGRAAQRIKCVRCGDSSDVAGVSAGSDDTVAAHFRRHGWEVDLRRQRHHCPTCIAIMTAERRESEARKRMTKTTGTIPAPGAPSVESALAKKLMSDALFDAYDMSARNYKPGWSDARIAKESGLSEAFVAQRRVADCGPVAPPRPDPLDAASNMAAHLTATLRDVVESAEALRVKASRALDQAAAINVSVAEAVASKAGRVA